MQVITPMHQMYDESVNLPQATMDSINHFCDKLCDYVNKNPKSIHDEYFDPTMQNVRAAAAQYGYYVELKEVTVGVTINTEWAGEHHITF